jgi:peptidoglycan hydrolase-like protein with peptidoglycan-binding domain
VTQPKTTPKAHRATSPPQPAKTAKPAARPAAAGPAQVSLKAVQQALNRAGYPAPHDGRLGESTRQVLRHFQRDHRLPATGQAADRATLHKLGLD